MERMLMCAQRVPRSKLCPHTALHQDCASREPMAAMVGCCWWPSMACVAALGTFIPQRGEHLDCAHSACIRRRRRLLWQAHLAPLSLLWMVRLPMSLQLLPLLLHLLLLLRSV